MQPNQETQQQKDSFEDRNTITITITRTTIPALLGLSDQLQVLHEYFLANQASDIHLNGIRGNRNYNDNNNNDTTTSINNNINNNHKHHGHTTTTLPLLTQQPPTALSWQGIL